MAFDYIQWLKFAELTGNKNLPERCDDVIPYHVVDWPDCYALYLRVAYERGELQVEPEK